MQASQPKTALGIENFSELTLDDPAFINSQPSKNPSSPCSVYSDYGSIPDEDLINIDSNGNAPQSPIDNAFTHQAVSRDSSNAGLIDDDLWRRLEGVFPILPDGLKSASFRVAYEITRVFQHVEVQVPWPDIRIPPNHVLENYDKLWNFLASLDILKDKVLPEKSSLEAWDVAVDDYQKGSHGVVLAGSLRFNPESTGPFFCFQLKPLKLDRSHRIGRRLGHSRFLEIDMPCLLTQRVVWDWFWHQQHVLFGYSWKPFFVKDVESRSPKVEKSRPIEREDDLHRVYFFAVAGRGLKKVSDPLQTPPETQKQLEIPIGNLLDMIRPFQENTAQPYLKLFARTSLALSRNIATLVLEQTQIRYVADIKPERHDHHDHLEKQGQDSRIMTDGAGRLSPSFANKVRQLIGISYHPSAFQGRIGSAKGLWVVDYNDTSNEDWIEISDSQRKWNDRQGNHSEAHHSSHRTFEVLEYARPLKPAKLNMQMLPIFIAQTKSTDLLRQTLKTLMKQGIWGEFSKLVEAFKDPLLLQQWTKRSSANTNDILRTGKIPYRAGMPISSEDQLFMMLDAGFTTDKNSFMKRLARSLLINRLNEFGRKLNIPLTRSTNVYIMADWWGVLEPGEVYLDFSSFVDDETGIQGERLAGRELLVARSPAHFSSDIQKVKAVVRAELMGLKDIMIFSTKGSHPLADKLSGGDYDGDKVFVCWEPLIVDGFTNAAVPAKPELAKEGWISKDKTTYAELVRDQKDPVQHFLEKSFEFNMRETMLGICTIKKEKLCYHSGTIDRPNEIYWHTLLSELVDQAKSGTSFDENSLKRFVKQFGPAPSPEQIYKRDDPVFPDIPAHIIDFLASEAEKLIGECKAEFHAAIPDPPHWDEDLVRCYKHARKIENEDWKFLLDQLDNDIKEAKPLLARKFRRDDESGQSFTPNLLAAFEIYQEIQPQSTNPLAQQLQDPCWDPETTQWALLRASALFASFSKASVSSYVWWLAGRQLAHLKAGYGSRGVHAVTSGMYISKKTNNSMISRLRSENQGPVPGGALDEDDFVDET
ncbi:RNA-dependent RNA polymerase [Lachnellula willkommii]|uniref:RNA-dependent RNA polymerase n=1 Tax=Lachnellula willkommii TaxID=215461 RepID=A0A559MCF7_9HELO|nr:RNA-dependent RNA polymerase [Lachnellula willkommii]